MTVAVVLSAVVFTLRSCYDLYFIICFVFVPLLVTLTETATSRDGSRACLSL